MGDREDYYPQIVIEESGGGAGAFLWGALLGAGVALLLAPRSGAETQADLLGAARRLRDAAEDRVGEARGRVTERVDRTRSRVEGRISSVREAVEVRADQARRAVDVGRHAARSAREDLQRRLDEAKATYRAGAASLSGDGAGAPEPPVAEVVITEVVVETETPDLAR